MKIFSRPLKDFVRSYAETKLSHILNFTFKQTQIEIK